MAWGLFAALTKAQLFPSPLLARSLSLFPSLPLFQLSVPVPRCEKRESIDPLSFFLSIPRVVRRTRTSGRERERERDSQTHTLEQVAGMVKNGT